MKNIVKCGNGVATVKQAKLIGAMEAINITSYCGKTVREASQYISNNKSTYEDYLADMAEEDDDSIFYENDWGDQ